MFRKICILTKHTTELKKKQQKYRYKMLNITQKNPADINKYICKYKKEDFNTMFRKQKKEK